MMIKEMVDGPKHRDIILGRSSVAKNHPGNVIFRSIISKHKPFYSSRTKRGEKNEVTQSVINSIKNAGGRFLANDGATWTIADERKVFEKVNQALREGQSRQKQKHIEARSVAPPSSLPSEDVYNEVEQEWAITNMCIPDEAPSSSDVQTKTDVKENTGLYRKGRVSEFKSRNHGTWQKMDIPLWDGDKVKGDAWEHESLPTCTTVTGTTFTGTNTVSTSSTPAFYDPSQALLQSQFPNDNQQYQPDTGYPQDMTLLQLKQYQVRRLQSQLQMVDERLLGHNQEHLGVSNSLSGYATNEQFQNHDGTLSTNSMPGFTGNDQLQVHDAALSTTSSNAIHNHHFEPAPVMSSNLDANMHLQHSNCAVMSPGLQSLQNPQLMIGSDTAQYHTFDQVAPLENDNTTCQFQNDNSNVSSADYHMPRPSHSNVLDNNVRPGKLDLGAEETSFPPSSPKEQSFSFPSSPRLDLTEVAEQDVFAPRAEFPGEDELHLSKSLSFMSFSDSSAVSNLRHSKSNNSLYDDDDDEHMKDPFSSHNDTFHHPARRRSSSDSLQIMMKDIQQSLGDADMRGEGESMGRDYYKSSSKSISSEGHGL